MFDAKSLLEALMGGGQSASGQAQSQGGGMGGIGDLLNQIGKAAGQSAPASAAAPAGGGGGLGDILGQLQKQLGGAVAGGGSAPAGSAGGAGGGLGDILAQLQKQFGGSGGGQGGAPGGGGIMDILTQILGQATSGVKEGAGTLDQMTGASKTARDAMGQATGKSPEDIMAQLQELIRNNQLGAGAALGGLGGLVLGTRTGRSAAASAAKLGSLVLIGGLAYKAYQNYSQGKPVIGGGQQSLAAAPNGSGFEPQAISNDTAVLYIRAMIAAAAADGRIDEAEQAKIFGGLAQAGLDDAAHTFLRNELKNPASVEDLVGAVKSPAEALQVYTAARLTVDVHAEEEHEFLAALAEGLGLDAKLVAHIDAEAAKAA